MKKLLIAIPILIFTLTAFSQAKVGVEANQRLNSISNIIELTDNQKADILQIFLDYIEQRQDIVMDAYADVVEFHLARVTLYTKSQVKIYEKLTDEQRVAYEAYKKSKSDQLRKAAQKDKEKIIQSYKQ